MSAEQGKLALPEQFEEISALIGQGEIERATSLLSAHAGNARYEALRIWIALENEEFPPAVAMQRLVNLMRQDPEFPGARAIYKEASTRSYSHGQSSLAHSHPPPPVSEDPENKS
jgi:hypothetical protein